MNVWSLQMRKLRPRKLRKLVKLTWLVNDATRIQTQGILVLKSLHLIISLHLPFGPPYSLVSVFICMVGEWHVGSIWGEIILEKYMVIVYFLLLRLVRQDYDESEITQWFSFEDQDKYLPNLPCTTVVVSSAISQVFHLLHLWSHGRLTFLGSCVWESLVTSYIFDIFIFALLWMKSRTLHVLGTCFITELYPPALGLWDLCEVKSDTSKLDPGVWPSRTFFFTLIQ